MLPFLFAAAAVVPKPLGPKICLPANPPSQSLTVVEARYKISSNNWDVGLIPRVRAEPLCMHVLFLPNTS